MAIWLVMVPEGQNKAASIPNISAEKASSSFTVGSSPNTSSPTGARNMASSISFVGRVCVSDRKSMVIRFSLQYKQFTPLIARLAKDGGKHAAEDLFCG